MGFVCVVVVVMVVMLMVAMGVVVLMVVVGVVLLVMVVRVACIGVVGVLCIGVLEVDCVEVVDILVLDAVFVVEGVVLVVGCVMRLVLCCFCWKPVEMNGQSIGGFLFGIVIWVDHFIFLEWGFLDKMVGADMLLDVVVVEVVVVGTVDVMQVCFFVFFRRGCLWDMMGNSGDRGCG